MQVCWRGKTARKIQQAVGGQCRAQRGQVLRNPLHDAVVVVMYKLQAYKLQALLQPLEFRIPSAPHAPRGQVLRHPLHEDVVVVSPITPTEEAVVIAVVGIPHRVARCSTTRSTKRWWWYPRGSSSPSTSSSSRRDTSPSPPTACRICRQERAKGAHGRVG